MTDEKGETTGFDYRQALPWTHLFRCFSVALDFRKLLLAAVGIVFTYLGWAALAYVFGQSEAPSSANYDDKTAFQKDAYRYVVTQDWKTWPANTPRPGVVDRSDGRVLDGRVLDNRNPYEIVTTNPKELGDPGFWTVRAPVLLEPLKGFFMPLAYMLSPYSSFLVWMFAILGLLWTLGVWAIFGGAITRMAAVQIARNEKVSMGDAVRFSVAKLVSFFSAPLFPAVGVAIITIIMMIVGGIILLVPWLGDFVAAVLFPLPLLGGLIIVAILLGYVGWPLQYATISTEGSDSFDALSRSYAYIYQRPWHYFFYWIIALLYGAIVTFFVVFMTSFFVYMSKWALSMIPWLGWRGEPVAALMIYAPTSYGWRDLLAGVSPPTDLSWAQYGAAGIMAFWLHLIFLMMLGFAYSFFWSASTMIYFLLRKKVDDTDMDEVYLEEEQEDLYPKPLGGEATAPPPPAPPAGGGVTSSTLPLAGGAPPPPPEPPKSG
jgi:hypothetical protein